jgi:hypothetical protein
MDSRLCVARARPQRPDHHSFDIVAFLLDRMAQLVRDTAQACAIPTHEKATKKKQW